MNPINQDPKAEYLVYTNNSQQTAKPKKKKHGCLIAFLIVLGVFIVACAAVTPFILKEIKYIAAEALIMTDDYDGAITEFEGLGTYRDSADRITDTKYLQAQYLADNENYEKAIEILQEISPYEDSDELAEEYVISYLDLLVEEKSFGELESFLETAQEIDGSDELEEACAYCEGVLEYRDGNYEEAAKALYDLGDYKEAEKYYVMAAHNYYCNTYKTVNSKETAQDIFEKLSNYKDDPEVQKMLTDSVYIGLKLTGKWECETGESMVFSDTVELNFPVKLSRYKNYYLVTSGNRVIAVNQDDEKDIVPIFQVLSFDKPDVLEPETLTILNSADNKEYVFKRVG